MALGEGRDLEGQREHDKVCTSFQTILSSPASSPCHFSESGVHEMLAHPVGLGSGGGSVRWQTVGWSLRNGSALY